MNTVPRRWATVVIFAATLLAPALTRPASAHHGSGGPVRLYLETVRLEPTGDV